MGLENYFLSGNGGSVHSSSSDQPSGGSSRLVGLVRGNQNETESIGDSPTLTSFAAESGPTPYDSTGFLELALSTQAFGPVPTGIGISEKGDIIRVNTSALEGPIEGGLY